MRHAAKILGSMVLALSLGSCFSLTHTVGNGGTGASQVSHRTWYLLWGLVPINAQDSRELAGTAMDYTVTTERGVLDFVLNVFTGWLSVVSQSETVTR